MTRQELLDTYLDRFSTKPALEVTSPGRTELAGNHTDHQGGHVIAAAVDRAVHGLAAANGTDSINLFSVGFGETHVSLDDLGARDDERGTTAALVRGMAAQFRQAGLAPAGFDMALYSDVLAGSGLSSSAAFELAIGQAMNALWAKGSIDAKELARFAQSAERDWFGKPCGLMDQAAVALGGIQHMDFSDSEVLKAKSLDFDFAEHGYAICIIAVGDDHAANIDDYAAVPREMQAVARSLGENVLSDLTLEDLGEKIPEIRAELGDRATLRAIHYFHEERLVAERAAALSNGDIERFLELTTYSGISSAMLLQNVSVGGASEQPSMLALAVATLLLQGQGAVRVHGGGFGGTIQAFVPLALIDDFSRGMDRVFGEGACGVYGIDHEGARATWL